MDTLHFRVSSRTPPIECVGVDPFLSKTFTVELSDSRRFAVMTLVTLEGDVTVVPRTRKRATKRPVRYLIKSFLLLVDQK